MCPQVNVNNMVHMFFSAFTWGYGLTFLSEVRTATHLPLSTTPADTQLILPPPSPSLPLAQIMAATGIKLSLLKWLDGGIFEANPEIPPIYMPWLWKEHSSTYRPRLTTLLASDVLVNGLLCPVIEEAIKLLVFRVCSRRIRQVRPPSLPPCLACASQALVLPPATAYLTPWPPACLPLQKARGGYNDPQPCVHSYIVHMVVVALGLKVADNNRRILLYTKPEVRSTRTPH